MYVPLSYPYFLFRSAWHPQRRSDCSAALFCDRTCVTTYPFQRPNDPQMGRRPLQIFCGQLRLLPVVDTSAKQPRQASPLNDALSQTTFTDRFLSPPLSYLTFERKIWIFELLFYNKTQNIGILGRTILPLFCLKMPILDEGTHITNNFRRSDMPRQNR